MKGQFSYGRTTPPYSATRTEQNTSRSKNDGHGGSAGLGSSSDPFGWVLIFKQRFGKVEEVIHLKLFYGRWSVPEVETNQLSPPKLSGDYNGLKSRVLWVVLSVAFWTQSPKYLKGKKISNPCFMLTWQEHFQVKIESSVKIIQPWPVCWQS